VRASTLHFPSENGDRRNDGLYQTRLLEYLNLFETVVNWPWFKRTSIMLFLTGMEEFGVKLQQVGRRKSHPSPFIFVFIQGTPIVSVSHSFHQVPLNEYFPEYMGGTDIVEGASYIRDQFLHLNRHCLSIYFLYVFPSHFHAVPPAVY
jgi:guanine nucleotide-binding protein subunit alpha